MIIFKQKNINKNYNHKINFYRLVYDDNFSMS